MADAKNEVGLKGETIDYLEKRIANAVKLGLRDVLTDKDVVNGFVGAALETIQQRASQRTGDFVLSGLKAAIHKAAWFVGLGLIVYSIGGWTAVAKVWQSLWGSAP